MAIQTVDMNELKKYSSNIYEICLLISARARQINAKRIEEKKETEYLDDVDLYDDADLYDRELLKDIKFEREINPTVIAQDEYVSGKVKAILPEIEIIPEEITSLQSEESEIL